MTTARADSGLGDAGNTKVVDWVAAVPKRVDNEDAMGADLNKATWEKAYKLAGMSTAGEEERRALRAAVYVYGLKNGTSREGEYAGEMVLATGKKVSAEIIVKAAGNRRIRKFFRANMIESYDFFKQSRVMESDERFIAKAANFGIPPESAFAIADWMTDCPKFTPSESRAHELVFARSIDRARRAREGDTLERVEERRMDKALEAQGPGTEAGRRIEF